MVEINNQHKAFLDMLAWSEGTVNGRQKTKEIMDYDVIVAEAVTAVTPITLANITLNPKLKSTGAGRYNFFPVGGMPQAAWPERLLSEKSDAARAAN